MRQLHLFRSQSPSGIRLEVELHQNPLVLYPLDPAEQNDGEHSRHLGATVVCQTGKKREIGGITVIRRVLVKRKFQNKWTPWETLQINETSVLQHCILDEGIHRFELSLPFPHNVPESRVTHHDRILHHVQAVLLDVPPTYLTASTSRLPSNLPVRSPSSKLGKISRKSKGKIAPTALALNQPLDRPELVDEIFEEGSESQHDVLATCSKTFEVVRSTGSKGDVPGINWGSMVRLPDSGKLYLRCSSDLFVLGSRLDFQLDFVNLGQDTTIHAVSAKLIQETGTPLKAELPDLSSPSASTTNLALPTSTTRDRPRRSGLGRLSSFLSSIKEKPPVPKSSVLDEYRLLGEGEDHVITPQGFLLRHGTNLWQGSISQAATEDESEAAPNAITPIFSRSRAQAPEIADSDLKAAVDGDEDSTQVTSSTLRMHRRVHLPSDIHGCCPTSDTLAPVLATVSHSLEVDVIYSIFGQDRLGKPLPPSGPQEGEMRLQRAMTEVNLAACTVGPATIQPPSYGPAHAATLTVPKSRPQASLSPIRRTLSRASSAYRKEPINKVVPKARTIPHSRSFKASNGVTVGAKAVFYPEGQLEEALIKHQQSHADCACGSEAPRFEVIVE